MKAMEILQQYWEQIKRLWAYIGYCVGNDIRAPVCREFWLWTVYISLALALLIVVFIGKKIYLEQLEFHRNKKRLEARSIVADAETIEEARWTGEDASDVELTEEELAARIREAMKVLAAQDSAHPAKDGGT